MSCPVVCCDTSVFKNTPDQPDSADSRIALSS